MIDEFLKIKIIVDDVPLNEYLIDELTISSLNGTCSNDMPEVNDTCSVLVTRLINEAYITMELRGEFSEIDGDHFTIQFTDVSLDTINQINNIMLADNLPH